MKPIDTNSTNKIFKAPKGVENCSDLPVRVIDTDPNVVPILESCWELSDEEIEVIKREKRIYLGVHGHSHPMVCLSVVPLV
ncbi:hypothetical protein [Intestinibacter sp.]|uniref:hypothetical protein n=1 Tax=Intestinibacter sp. TaxID=1965304 RepID=UPI002A74BC68|nr:hypothetical protein [Intestinibacter sp.]MDY2735949.1 hypothetical protein [Intestinibacter sp.]